MPRVEISIECLCLFARDEENGVIHVLMPCTDGCHGGVFAYDLQAGSSHDLPGPGAGGSRAAAVPPHTTRFVAGAAGSGPVMDGWALVIDGTPSPVSMDLSKPTDADSSGVLADLTYATGRTVPRKFVQGGWNPEVAARLTLRGGTLKFLDGDGKWLLGRRKIAAAHRATWAVDDVKELLWDYIGPPLETGANPPDMPALSSIAPDPDGVCRFEIRCAVEKPDGTLEDTMKADDIALHFACFETLLGSQTKRAPRLQNIVPPASDSADGAEVPTGYYIACRSGQAKVG
jgi:hypothetical protein